PPTWNPGLLEAYYGENWKDDPNAKLNIVAHSQGGLVARYYLQRGGADKVKRLITIGTPHRGSGLATAAKVTAEVHPLALIRFGWQAVAVRCALQFIPHVRYAKLGAIEDLRPKSQFLKALNANVEI
ncbi:MAG: alpha/beta fold hydrolase, partial [bacterium]